MIERSLIAGGTVSSAFSAILSIVAMKEASGTLWKVVFPKGISGELMQMANGLYTTSIVGEGGKILAQAGLIPVMGNLFPSLLAFSGITQFVTNVQKLNILLHSNIIFFDKETSKEVERAFEDIRNSFTAKGAVERVDEDIRKVIVPYIYYLYSSFYTYILGKILESVLSSSTYNTYFDNLLINIYETRNVLEKQIKGLIDLIDKELNYRVENAWFSKERLQRKREAIRETLTNEITMLNGEIENFIGRAKQAHKMLSQPFEIIVGDNRIYLPDAE